ncbi:MAG TPA: TIGR01244 family sulfur transferase, partial [Nitrosomonas sp.]|nr:TIGR01244 family sulfur transferase [Nitrosomonas sp.]
MSIEVTRLDEKISVTGQISVDDLTEIAASGFKSIICNRPDFEGGEHQPASEQLEEEARNLGMTFAYLPVRLGAIPEERGEAFRELIAELPGPVLAFCGSGRRATALYAMTQPAADTEEIHHKTVDACNWGNAFDVVVVGGGSAGIGVTASILKRRPALRIAIIEP